MYINPYVFVGLCGNDTGITTNNLDNMPNEVIESVLNSKLNKVSINELMEVCISVVCDFYGTTRDALYGKNRDSNLVDARYAAMYIIWKYFGMKKKHISRYLNIDNSTAHHGINKVSNKVDSDPEYEKEILTLANNARMKEKELLIN